jgi:hypothetical protein
MVQTVSKELKIPVIIKKMVYGNLNLDLSAVSPLKDDISVLKMFNLIKKVLFIHSVTKDGVRAVDVKLISVILREIKIKMNCVL